MTQGVSGENEVRRPMFGANCHGGALFEEVVQH